MSHIVVTVTPWASLRDLMPGDRRYELRAGSTAHALLDAVASRWPAFESRRPTTALAIGDSLIVGARVLNDGDDVSLLPPVSGGSR
jgi:molybdopterin converting factor small subunit